MPGSVNSESLSREIHKLTQFKFAAFVGGVSSGWTGPLMENQIVFIFFGKSSNEGSQRSVTHVRG